MELKKALEERRAIRGFTSEPVSQETLREVLRLGTRAVSAVNSQPWEFAVVTGDVLKALCEDNIACLQENLPKDLQNRYPDGVYRTRRIDLAKQLFASMEIERGDTEKRNWWSQRGYRFFDAPAGIILYMDRSVDSMYRFDVGCVAQNICVAAMEFGLGTCVAYQVVEYERGLRQILNIPESKELICGIAIGYPDWTFPANNVGSPRENVDAITTWYGF